LAPWIGCLAGCLVCGLAAAQGTPSVTTWQEQLYLSASDSIWGGSGTDNLVPEDLLEGLGKDGSGLAGYVVFHNAPFPPECGSIAPEYGPHGTALLSASVVPGVPLDGLAGFTIEFQFRIVQTSAPTVEVTEVPVQAEVCGTVEAGGNYPALIASSYGSIAIWHFVEGFPTSYLINAGLNASINPSSGFPTVDSFHFQRFEFYPVDAILDGRMVTGVSCYSVANPTESGSASSNVFVDPVIEVADQTIPGTSESYRDHFALEFGAGYYALGEPTPVVPTTWGNLKTRYRP